MLSAMSRRRRRYGSRRRGRGRSKFIFPVLLAIAVALIAWWTQPQYPSGPSIRVASWNLRHFGGGREALDLPLISQIIADERFDLIAIQEVRDGQTVLRLAEMLPISSGQDWQVLVSEQTGNSERFAFVYDASRIEFLDEAGFLPSRLEIDRRPFAARFRADTFDFTLVNIHLYYSDLSRRRGEAERLAAALHSVAVPAGRGERDVIVIGDFNTTRRQGGTLTPFESRGWTAAIDAPTNLGDGEMLDNIVFDHDHVREWAGTWGVVKFDEKWFGSDDDRATREVSDHRPIWTEFVINLGDDD